MRHDNIIDNNFHPLKRNSMFQIFKSYFFTVSVALIALFDPIIVLFYILFATFLFNIVTGVITDIWVNKAEFSASKAFSAFFQMAFIMALVYYLSAVLTGLKLSYIAEPTTKWLVFLAVYFYSTNIIRNVTTIWPNNSFFKFIYEVMSTIIFRKIKETFMFNLNKKNDNEL